MRKNLLLLVAVLVLVLLSNAGTKVEGAWYLYNDAANEGTSTIYINGKPTTEFAMTKAKIEGKEMEVSMLEGNVTLDFQYGFIGMGVKIEGKGKDLIKKAKGIKFKCIGDPASDCQWYRVRIETTNVKDFDVFGKRFKAYPDKVMEYEIPFSKVKQQGWGKAVSFNTKFINQISFQTEGQPYKKVKLYVWDLEIIDK